MLEGQLSGVLTFGEDLVVRTRFISPRLSPRILHRPRIDAYLAGITDHPLTLLRAEAGYGKTIAIASFLARANLPFFWCNLSDLEADPLVFLLHLIYLFRTRLPSIGERALHMLSQEGGAMRFWSPAVDTLVNDLLEALARDDPTVVVLDDYCAIDSPEINAIVSRFIEHSPPCVHLVLTTRSSPGLPNRSRWRASGELLEIGRNELAFTPQEAIELFAQRTGESLPSPIADMLVTETEGWPIAVQMLIEQSLSSFLIRHLPGREAIRSLDEFIRHLPGSAESLFNYLAEEVYYRQSLEIRAFLSNTAILRHLDADICNHLLKRTDSQIILHHLEKHSLFTTHYEGTYRYHHLFRNFLLHHPDLSPSQQRTLHLKAATYYRERGEYEEAVFHYLQAEEYALAAEVLTSIADSMLQGGRHQTLATWLHRMPDDLLEAYPELLLAQGHAYRFASRYHEALSAYARAQRSFAARGMLFGEACALEGQATVYLDTVQPSKAEPLLSQALRKVGRGAKEKRAELLILLAENKINQGQLRQAERLHRRVFCTAKRSDIPPMDPRLYVRDGRFALAQQIIEDTLRTDPWGVGQWRAPRSHREATVLLAWIHAMTGEGKVARRYAEQSLELGRTLGSPIVECVSLARLGHSWLSDTDYNIERARAYYNESLLLAKRIGVARFGIEALLGLIVIAGLEGSMLEAEEQAHQALSILEEAGDRYLMGVLYLALGATAVLCECLKAEKWLSQAQQIARACGDRFVPCLSNLWLAFHYDRFHHPSEAKVALLQALSASQEHGYHFVFTRIPLLGLKNLSTQRELLTRLLPPEQDPLALYAVRVLHNLNLSTELLANHEATAPLYIQTLGRFRVWRYGREIEPRAWERKKALELLQLLVCCRGRYLHQERILEALWPESSPQKAFTGLRVALSTLRKLLSPIPSEGEGFICRIGENLQLNLADGVAVDADHFTRLLQLARKLETHEPEKAINVYESALALYQGDFLEDNPYAEWASEEREYLLVQYITAAEHLAQLYLQLRDYERAIYWGNAILAKDPLWEEAYTLLMECYWMQGRRTLALRTFERCRKRLGEALGLAPSPRTLALFEVITRSESGQIGDLPQRETSV